MQTYVILRRNGWRDGPDLEAAAARSSKVGDEDMPDDIRWIRSYVLAEEVGRPGHRLRLPGLEPGGHPRPRRAPPACPPTRSSRSPTRVIVREDPAAAAG